VCLQIGAAQPCQSLALLQKHGFPADKALGAGVIDGRNIWADTGKASQLLAEIKKSTSAPIRVQVGHLPRKSPEKIVHFVVTTRIQLHLKNSKSLALYVDRTFLYNTSW
jgi:5-methyltetrahydropteroyltriglutamate--homocysteine methyltransferase